MRNYPPQGTGLVITKFCIFEGSAKAGPSLFMEKSYTPQPQSQEALGGLGLVPTGAPGVLVQAKYQLLDFRKLVKTENRKVTLIKKTPRAMTADKRPRNTLDYTMSAYMLPNTGGQWVGVPIGVNQDGTYKWKRFNIKNSKAFDLSVWEDAVEFFMWTNSEYFSGSILAITAGRDDRDLLIVSDPERDSAIYVEKRMKAAEYEQKILMASDEDVKNMGILFNINPAANSLVIIKKRLIQELNANPDGFKSKVAGENNANVRTAQMIFNMARFNEVISFDTTAGMFVYNNTPIGADEGQVINKFLKDPSFAMSVRDHAERAMQAAGQEVKHIAIEAISNVPTPPATPNKDVEKLVNLVQTQQKENESLREILMKQQQVLDKFLNALPDNKAVQDTPVLAEKPAPDGKPKTRRNGTSALKAKVTAETPESQKAPAETPGGQDDLAPSSETQESAPTDGF